MQFPAVSRFGREVLEQTKMAAVMKELQRKSPGFGKSPAKAELEQLVTEVMQIKEFLPKILNSELINSYAKLESTEKELETCQAENYQLRLELEQIRSMHEKENEMARTRQNLLLRDQEKSREEKYELKCELAELLEQLNEQQEYCTNMGAAACTLLWRVSRQQDSVISLLGGNKADEFLQIAAKTVESYFATFSEEENREKSDEFQFVLAICGTVTNIAASSNGRDFLVARESGRALIDTFMSVISGSGTGNNVKLRSLILMALYNTSINVKGLQCLIGKRGTTKVLLQLVLGETDLDLRLNAARLMQSLVMEPNSLTCEALAGISLSGLQELACSSKGELRDVLLEVISDLQTNQLAQE